MALSPDSLTEPRVGQLTRGSRGRDETTAVLNLPGLSKLLLTQRLAPSCGRDELAHPIKVALRQI